MDTLRPKSVKQLCDYYGISNPHYYALKAKGIGPAELRLGHRTIITREAERAWVGGSPHDPRSLWMKHTVRRFNADRERLNDTFLINDEKYYKHYHIQRMDAIFPFAVGTNTGECRISL
ncbi:helix-turn-helix transcriptional regulator [Paraburkholderia unamae]|uniref:Uncharacterized protein n=1 Tax=Paraburkholderia unamae TaxID=219649 RepID=A0ABX5K7M2_9BURK|nr:hypothetical protein [Paraburkholderia unamae]PVX59453.1 hypothetical protein C7402_1594 [Paraburkholderia unamae]CAG9249728.1 hypothetical protein PUN4_1450009 [Paraburkholderia unamae]